MDSSILLPFTFYPLSWVVVVVIFLYRLHHVHLISACMIGRLTVRQKSQIS